MKEIYQKVAYIALRNPDGTFQMNVPLYIKVSEVNKQGVPVSQEALIHKVSQIMTRRYEKQISAFMASKSTRKEDFADETQNDTG